MDSAKKKTSEKKSISNARYDKTHTKAVKFKMNLNTDKDILDYLDSLDNKQGYFKSLVRADIASKRNA